MAKTVTLTDEQHKLVMEILHEYHNEKYEEACGNWCTIPAIQAESAKERDAAWALMRALDPEWAAKDDAFWARERAHWASQ